MTQSSPIEPFNEPATAVADYRQQAREFLLKSRQYLAEHDLHQASEKGWGAAAWMAKAVADAQGWEYERHPQFSVVLNSARRATGDARLLGMAGIANDLHGNFYTRKGFLDAESIALGLDQMAILLDILESLTETGQEAEGNP